MAVPASSGDFVHQLRASALIDEPALNQYLQDLRQDDDLPHPPEFLAGWMVRDGLLTSFQAEQLLQGRYRNFLVGKYKLLQPLGSGGMSMVFLCEHVETGKRAAIKIPTIRDGSGPAILARFFREARIIAGLNHPNVVRAYEIDCTSDHVNYIIMDFVEGVGLDELVRRRSVLAPGHAAQYIAQTATGLQHIHDAGLIHRDLKPGNLLLDREGIVKILDLGLARMRHDSERITDTFKDGVILGTADFIAPEQTIIGGEIDTRADIYSLGATFYYMLAGQTPFPERKISEKIQGHQSREPISVRKHQHTVPEEMAKVLAKMMAKKPEDRYQTAREVADALARWFDLDVPPPDECELPPYCRQSPAALETGVPSPSTGLSLPATPDEPRWNSRRELGLSAGVILVAIIAAASMILVLRP